MAIIDAAFVNESMPELLGIYAVGKASAEEILEHPTTELLVPSVATRLAGYGIAKNAEPGCTRVGELELAAAFLLGQDIGDGVERDPCTGEFADGFGQRGLGDRSKEDVVITVRLSDVAGGFSLDERLVRREAAERVEVLGHG